MIAFLVILYIIMWLVSWGCFYVNMVAEGGVDLELLDVAVPLLITFILSALWPLMWAGIYLKRRVDRAT